MQPQWTLIASHGTVLFYLATHEETTIREIAHTIDLTERRVAQIIRDLSASGALAVERRGRRNAYRINLDTRFENPYCDVPLARVVNLIRDAGEAARSPSVARVQAPDSLIDWSHGQPTSERDQPLPSAAR